MRSCAILLAIVLLASCAKGDDPRILARTQYGIACRPFVYPGTTPNPHPPPFTYLAGDVGKPGVPKPTPFEFAVLKRIERYVQSKTLRIGWVGAHDFIVFDATDGPCSGAALGYEVLNAPCDTFYQPGENPYGVHPGPPEGITCKRPWEAGAHRERGT